jgi:hypothetical protein
MWIITIGLPILAFTVAFGLLKFVTFKEGSFNEPRANQLTIGIQIICGDCSGDAVSPVKTYLDRSGTCAQCGGRSFMLASTRIVYAHQQMLSCLSDREIENRSQTVEASQTTLYGVRVGQLTA